MFIPTDGRQVCMWSALLRVVKYKAQNSLFNRHCRKPFFHTKSILRLPQFEGGIFYVKALAIEHLFFFRPTDADNLGCNASLFEEIQPKELLWTEVIIGGLHFHKLVLLLFPKK